MIENDYIDNLSNKELRAKCVEYGLPNVPITDSSRKLLIRRLRAAMESTTQPNTARKTNRRETIHSSKISSNKELNNDHIKINSVSPSRANKRQTLAGTSISHLETPTYINAINTTRSPKQKSEALPIPILVEDTLSHLRANQTLTSDKDILRLRRSSSLSKSGVITTSYNQETVPLGKRTTLYEEEVSDNDVDGIDYSAKPSVYGRNSFQTYSHQSHPHTLPNESYGTDYSTGPSVYGRNSFQTYDHQKNAHTLPNKPYIMNKTSSMPLSQPMLNSTRYSTLDKENYNTMPTPFLNESTTHATANLSGYNKPVTAPRLYPNLFSDSDRNFKLHNLSRSATNYTNTKTYVEQDEEVDNEESSGVEEEPEPLEQSYRSSFTRGLEQQKNDLFKRNNARSSYTPNYRNAPKPRPNLDSSVQASFYQFLNLLEEKYHIKHILFLILIFLLTVFIYVVFIQDSSTNLVIQIPDEYVKIKE